MIITTIIIIIIIIIIMIILVVITPLAPPPRAGARGRAARGAPAGERAATAVPLNNIV